MAYQQQQGGMGNGGGAAVDQHVPPATEYTLQGVMRFLQLEWHNHERARNSWDIERAEMKAKIAKQEGELRQSKRFNEQLNRQLRMLEQALKNERAKSKNAVQVDGTETKKAAAIDGEMAADGLPKKRPGSENSNLPHNSLLDVDANTRMTDEQTQQYMDETSKYLKNCMMEMQYLLTRSAIPPVPMLPDNGVNYTGLVEGPIPNDDYYQRQQALARPNLRGLPPQNVLSYQAMTEQSNGVSQAALMQDESAAAQRYDHSDGQYAQARSGPSLAQHNASFEEAAESVTHTFDARGRAVQQQEEPRGAPPANQDTDGWTFDEEASANDGNADVQHPRRPDTDLFPSVNNAALPAKSPPRSGPGSNRRRSSGSQGMLRRKSSQGKNEIRDGMDASGNGDPTQFKVKFALRGHLDVVRSVIFSGGGSPSEPEVCTAGDDGTVKRWMVPASYQTYNSTSNTPDLDVQACFTHRGHEGIVTSLAACPLSTGFATGGRQNGDGWIFSGGQDATIRVWERGRVDPKETLIGHSDAVWCVCVLPMPVGNVFGAQSNNYGGPDRLILVSGSADGSVKVWSVSAPPQTLAPPSGTRRGVGGSRRHSVTSGSNFPTSPQPSVASPTPFYYNLIHSIERASSSTTATAADGETPVKKASPTCITPLSPNGESFVVSYTDSAVLIFDTRTGEEIIGMASGETYDGTMSTSVNSVVALSQSLEGSSGLLESPRGLDADEAVGGGATGSKGGVEGVVISGHEDRYVRFFDANSGQCTYTMLAHPSAISCLCLSKDGREAVSAGHDASIRFWSLEKRICTQDIVSHRAMRGEGVCAVCWSQDGRLVVSAGGDGIVKVFAR